MRYIVPDLSNPVTLLKLIQMGAHEIKSVFSMTRATWRFIGHDAVSAEMLMGCPPFCSDCSAMRARRNGRKTVSAVKAFKGHLIHRPVGRNLSRKTNSAFNQGSRALGAG